MIIHLKKNIHMNMHHTTTFVSSNVLQINIYMFIYMILYLALTSTCHSGLEYLMDIWCNYDHLIFVSYYILIFLRIIFCFSVIYIVLSSLTYILLFWLDLQDCLQMKILTKNYSTKKALSCLTGIIIRRNIRRGRQKSVVYN